MNKLSRNQGKLAIIISMMLLAFFLLMLDWSSYHRLGLMYVLSEGNLLTFKYNCHSERSFGYFSEACADFHIYFKYMVIIPFGLFIYGLYPLISEPEIK